MTNGELIDWLIKEAVSFYKDVDFIKRNSHMFGGLTNEPGAIEKAAVLTGFLNHFASRCSMDLGMYLKDFLFEADKKTTTTGKTYQDLIRKAILQSKQPHKYCPSQEALDFGACTICAGKEDDPLHV